jgi:hypothetical protein
VITEFNNIPDIFIDRYDAQFVEWAQQFQVRGKSLAIVFDILPGQQPSFDSEGRLKWTGAWLTAELESGIGGMRMVISPASDWDRYLINMHSWNLKRVMLT